MSAAAAAGPALKGAGATGGAGKGGAAGFDASALPLSGPARNGAQAAGKAPGVGTARKVIHRTARVPGVRRGVGSLRGFAAGSLALIALEVLGRRADQFGGFLTFTSTLLEHAVSPDVPAIPWLSKTPPSGGSVSSASGPAGAAVAPVAATAPGTAVVSPVFGLNPSVAYLYGAPLLTEQTPAKGA